MGNAIACANGVRLHCLTMTTAVLTSIQGQQQQSLTQCGVVNTMVYTLYQVL
jgi:hypothetical protein